jgi:hypothetical protein
MALNTLSSNIIADIRINLSIIIKGIIYLTIYYVIKRAALI